jgi:peptidoglycan/LPS O-acetylase OafA/YrhL
VRAPTLPLPRQISGLDGVRALAVLAVLAFHGGLSSTPGGFLGVDTFFALSGFLITSLLLGEWGATHRIRLAAFWGRRARRLLPALLLLLLALGIAHAVAAMPAADPGFRAEALATLFYVSNWHLIAAGSNYFSAAGLSPLTHTWSLAIEEQFYLVWPFVVIGVLRKSRTLLPLAVVCVAGALASAVEMAVLFRLGADTSRLYYGTDTHAQCLLVGAALAVVLTGWATRRGSWEVAGRGPRIALSVLGAVGLAVTVVMWTRVSGTGAFVFQGGFLVAALAAVLVLLAVVTVPGGPLSRALSFTPLRGLGRISYGVYLWHLPLFLVLDGARTGLTGYPLFALRVAVTLVVATVSYVLVERPIRQRMTLRSWRSWALAPAAVAGSAAAIVLAAMNPSATFAASAAAPPSLSGPSLSGPPPSKSSLSSSSLSAPPAGRPSATATTAPASSGAGTAAGPIRVLVVGDSLGGTLAAGLGVEGPLYGVQVFNEGEPGCSVSMDGDFHLSGLTLAPGPPCRIGDPGALLAAWRGWVTAINPDVVVYLARGETVGSILRSVASRSPANVSLFDLGAVMSPGGQYASKVDGVTVRCGDGVHFSLAAGKWLAGFLFPELVELGADHHRSAPATASGVEPPPVVPAWMNKLPCGSG